jgi:hypothetical protein
MTTDWMRSAVAILIEVINECHRIHTRYGDPASAQESIGVIAEEWTELQEAVRNNQQEEIYLEAIQIAACALRLAMAVKDRREEFLLRSGLSV